MHYKARFYDQHDHEHEVDGLELDEVELHLKSVLRATRAYDDIVLVELKPNEFCLYGELAGLIVAEAIGYVWPADRQVEPY